MLDEAGQMLFEGNGGIQLIDTIVGSKSVTVPEPSLFMSPNDDELAVNTAMRALAPARMLKN